MCCEMNLVCVRQFMLKDSKEQTGKGVLEEKKEYRKLLQEQKGSCRNEEKTKKLRGGEITGKREKLSQVYFLLK